MATFDQLSPEKRAIVELVLQQGKTYPELAEMLGMPEPRVRELARDALVELAPVSVRGVEDDWRGQLADYVLGQQSGPEATATKGHLRRSEAARSWARSLLDSLEQLYANGSVPAIPDGERGRASRRPAAAAALRAERERRARAGCRPPTPSCAGVCSPERVWPRSCCCSWCSSGRSACSPAATTTAAPPPAGDDAQPAAEQTSTDQGQPAASGAPAGIAIVIDREGKKQLLVQAARLAPSGENEGYYVWLYNSPDDARRSADR